MRRALAAIRHSARDERGQDLLEYAMLTTLIAVGAILLVTQVGGTINSTFWQVISANVAATL